jgi:Protein of unknown function (DUF2934)
MARQSSGKVAESTRTPGLPAADPSGLQSAENEPSRASEPKRSVSVQDEVDRDLRHRLISEAAYKLYAHRGYIDGFALADWLQAEAEVDQLLGHRATKN